MDQHYYQIFLELWRNDELFAMINISKFPYARFEELFAEQFVNEKFLFDNVAGYYINEELYNENKAFFDNEFPVSFDFELFDYWVAMCSVKTENYQKDYYTAMPAAFNTTDFANRVAK
jgi:hypothetical protein